MGNSTSADLQKSPQVKAQNDLLDMFCSDKCDITSHSIDLPSGSLNYVEIFSKSKKNRVVTEDCKTLILAHGYGSGLGFFYPNYPSLSLHYDRVISIDWLGMGSSSRTPANSTRTPYRGALGSLLGLGRMTPTAATNFFVDSLEEFRLAKGLTAFTLVGHSLGGYLCARYALKYPSHIAGLVLVSPVGVPPLPSPELHVPSSQLSMWLRVVQNAWFTNFTPQMYVRMQIEARGMESVRNTMTRRFGPDKFTVEQFDLLSRYLYHITAAPPCGEYALNSILTPVASYKTLPTEADMAAAVERAKQEGGSGDAAASRRAASRLPSNMSIGVFAHEPLENLFRSYTRAVDAPTFHDHTCQQQVLLTKKQCSGSEKIKRGSGEINGKKPASTFSGDNDDDSVRTPIHFPILVMYGDTDWLNYDGIRESIKTWGNGPERQEASVASTIDSSAHGKKSLDVKYVTIPKAGHHIYLDNPNDFHAAILRHDQNKVEPRRMKHLDTYKAALQQQRVSEKK